VAKSLLREAGSILGACWSEICKEAEAGLARDRLEDDDLVRRIRACINSQTKTYRYVLPTQLLAKLADARLDCRCLQRGRGEAGSFDARTIAHKVVVPFDQANENVLGGSPEPYVNNPLRVPEVSTKYRNAQRNRKDWDHLCRVLELVENKDQAEYTRLVFLQTLKEIYRRLSDVSVSYPAPRRISLDRTIKLIEDFLANPSGGDRLLALTTALFLIIGKRFALFTDVRRGNVTSADAATGMVADLECLSEKGEVVLAVEVKDRDLTVSQIRTKVPNIREKHVAEIFFIAQGGVAPSDRETVSQLVGREFARGQNLYVMDIFSLGKAALALLGEEGRIEFLAEVGRQLDKYRSDIVHRRAWSVLLGDV